MKALKRIIKRGLRRAGYEIRPATMDSRFTWTNPPSDKKHAIIRPTATYSPWIDNVSFREAYEKIKNHTMVDVYRCYELWELAQQSKHVEGDILEVGVWRGGTGALLGQAMASSSKKIFLADTFAGVVKAGGNDTYYKGGEHDDTSIEIVRDLIRSLNLQNVELLCGVFPEDTSRSVMGNLSLVHCDVDVYSSTKEIVEWCAPRLSIGSVLVFDDFGFSGCEGVTTYCEEIKSDPRFKFVHNLNGHAVLIKVAQQ